MQQQAATAKHVMLATIDRVQATTQQTALAGLKAWANCILAMQAQ